MPVVEILCEDSFLWLPQNRGKGHIITSPPSSNELGLDIKKPDDLETYKTFFSRAIYECLTAIEQGCCAVFIFTDQISNGWLSKADITFEEARGVSGVKFLAHKMELRLRAGNVDLYRPGYRHILFFGRGNVKMGKRSPDVIRQSKPLYKNGLGEDAVQEAVRVCLLNSPESTIIDPFCGYGTVPMVAKRMGALYSIGIDIDEKQCHQARLNVLK